MSSGENIINAINVIYNTYDNLNKFMSHLRLVAERDTLYAPVTDKFLRFKSDKDYYGWMITRFILLFQHKNDELLTNGWRNGPVYSIDIILNNVDANGEGKPIFECAQYEYKSMRELEKISPAHVGMFTNPKDMLFRAIPAEPLEHNGIAYIRSSEIDEDISKQLKGLKYLIFSSGTLTFLTPNNVEKEVFGDFNFMREQRNN